MEKFLINLTKKKNKDSNNGSDDNAVINKEVTTSKSLKSIDEDNASSLSSSTVESLTTDDSRKRKKMSLVWNYFKRSKDKKLAKCYTCGKEYKTSGNTSNLSDHLRRFHPLLTTSETSSATTSFASSGSSTARSSQRSVSPFFREHQYDNTSQRKKLLDNALVRMIASDFQPFTIVKDEGFKTFVHLLDPRYVLPCPDTIKNRLLKDQYTEAFTKLFDILKHVKYVGITTDIWTSVANDSYICVTSHFINSDFNIKRAILTTKQLHQNHTSENIAQALQEIFDEWNISDKISCIVTDNAANMLKACELLKKKNLPCFAHTLNLAIQENFNKPDVQNVIKRCKEIVTFFKSSCIATEKFQDEQKQLWKGTANENKRPYKLLQEVPTRWNSCFYMIQRILQTSDALNSVLLKLRSAPQPLTIDNIAVLKDFEKSLTIFEDATQNISGYKYVTVSLIIPITHGIFNYLNSATMSTEIGMQFCNGLIQSVRNRLFVYESRSIPRISTILDARFKKEGFRSVENANQAASFLEQEMTNSLRLTKVINEKNKDDSEETESTSALFDFMNQKLKDKARNVTADAIITKRQYLERQNAPKDSDPLLFWKVNGIELEPMQDLAKKYFCIPGSSVESERNFSAAGQILTDRRSTLKSNYVNMLMFLNKNS